MDRSKNALVTLALLVGLLASIAGTGMYLFEVDRWDPVSEYRPQ